ncbi:MAG: MGMT family protein [Candidatus Eisenbacteria bacterium]
MKPRDPEPATRGRTYARIFAMVRRIPEGKVASYGEVADWSGLPRQARLVGYALHASGSDFVPWHRVVNAAGVLSLGKLDPSGAVTQRLRLQAEGVTFDARGRVRMDLHRWPGPRKKR